MAIRIVRLGTPLAAAEGVRLGTVRRPPRGVKKADYARRDYFDAWLPELSRSAARLLDALARLSRDANFAVGCYGENYQRCHRSILEQLLLEHGADVAANRS